MRKSGLFLLTILLITVLVIGCTSQSSKSSTPVPTTPAGPPFETQPITDASVRNGLQTMDLSMFIITYEFQDPDDYKNILEVEVNDDPTSTNDGKNVRIRYFCDNIWDTRHFLSMATRTDLAIMYNLFKNPKLNKLTLESATEFSDKYGNSKTENGLTVTFNRATAEKINYENFKDMVSADNMALLRASDSYNIHPAILKELQS